jgi:hypothetical protein
MAITIQEILASDTISQFVDKVNFNFDQLILNGGGAPGPFGPQGLPGPIGGRGERGTEWYQDLTVSPGTDPNTIIVSPNLLDNDFYLQANGQVWEYDGVNWGITNTNLTGPQGPAGVSIGWDSFGNNPLGTYVQAYQNALYPAIIGGTSGATSGNGGLSSVVIGAISPTDIAFGQAGFNAKFNLSTDMAGNVDTTVMSMLVHQQDSGVSAIKFMGGETGIGDNFEQDDPTLLAGIQLAPDDSLLLTTRKTATAPGSITDTYGIKLNASERGLNLRAGLSIDLTTGVKGGGTSIGGGIETSDLNIELNTMAGGNGAKLNFVSIGAGAANRIQSGGNILLPGAISGIYDGITLIESSIIQVDATEFILLRSNLNATIKSEGALIRLIGDDGAYLNGGGAGGVVIGNDYDGVNTTGALISTLTNDQLGVTIAAGYGAVYNPLSTYQTAKAINLVTDSSSGMGAGNINLNALNPGLGGGIDIDSGANGSGYLSLRSKGQDLSLSTGPDSGGLGGNIKISVDTGTAVEPTPVITIASTSSSGLVPKTAYFGYPSYISNNFDKPAIVISASDGPTGGSGSNNPTIRLGLLGAEVGTGSDPWKRFPGGAMIKGPYAPVSTVGPAINIEQEPESVLHINGGTTASGAYAGGVWIYSPDNASATMPNLPFPNIAPMKSSVRIWGTADTVSTRISNAGETSSGVTIGLNQDEFGASANKGGNNVSGTTHLYGIGYNRGNFNSTGGTGSALVAGLTLNQGLTLTKTSAFQNWPQSPVPDGPYGGVNVGDQYRHRQTFKVWGDYVGDHYISKFGGAYSGPTIQEQTFMSGSQGWSSTVDLYQNADIQPSVAAWTTAGLTPKIPVGFQYRYQWMRVGRVVTGSGLIRFITNRSPLAPNGESSTSNTSIDLYPYWSSLFSTSDYSSLSGSTSPAGLDLPIANVFIGPIPLPMQVSGAGNSTDSSLVTGTLYGAVSNVNISGIATGLINSDGHGGPRGGGQAIKNAINQSGGGFSTNGTGTSYGKLPWMATNITVGSTVPVAQTSGEVQGGSQTDPAAAHDTNGSGTHMWINLHSNPANTRLVVDTDGNNGTALGPINNNAPSAPEGSRNAIYQSYHRFTFTYEIANP